MQRAGQPVRALGENSCAGRGFDLGRRRRMVAMGMSDDDVSHRLAAYRVEQRLDMCLSSGPGSMIATLPRPTM